MTPKFLEADLFRKQAEGGYSFTPTDNGGETLFGVSRVANPRLPMWTLVDHYTGGKPILTHNGRAVNPTFQIIIDHLNADTILQQDAEDVFFNEYWLPVQGDALPEEVDMVVYDMAVNSGPGQAIKTLQRALKTVVTGRLSPGDISVANQLCARDQDPEILLNALFAQRLAFYKALVATNPAEGVNLHGWINRLKNLASFIQLDPLPPCLL